MRACVRVCVCVCVCVRACVRVVLSLCLYVYVELRSSLQMVFVGGVRLGFWGVVLVVCVYVGGRGVVLCRCVCVCVTC